ncbi:hypothetical protein PFICI_13931 [Pestalotiopsis fici W106-1]|uniref:Heterokaryon incompatibility domain-containing protein n=1 Tax=Pestalotiopsis fici (strain W106-1 / CGMCC3.15140) TaxID=1229662 RepID=W3WJF5_PESFW|nr:uncharacterized protein PFICI_13931 [Pestalotiopsis fici W106-1]ETS74065.1 hypothetical protein PFICI_13931 [Pestalotiopsis fici W106-1]
MANGGDPGIEMQNGQLCQGCEKLNLTIEKFIPAQSEGPSQLPGVLGNTFDPSGLDCHSLGYLDEIYQRRLTCPLCRLLFEATHSQGEQFRIGLDGLTEEGKRIACMVDWILDGRLLDDNSNSVSDHGPQTTNPSRRLHIFNPDGTFPDAYIVPLKPALQGTKADSSPSFLGRLIPHTHVDIERLKRWLDLCDSTHHAACKPPSRMIKMQGLAAKVRYIDLQEERIVEPHEMPDEFEYATASYVWGATQMAYMLYRSNYDEFRRHLPVRSESMQRTLRDVMAVVYKLGIRFVWIDALCIIQGDEEDWEKMAPLMEHIYSSGKINICAAAGFDANRGMPGSVHTPRTTQQLVTRCFGLDLIAVKPVESRIRYTQWNSRAWTFQERMLSPRSLVFVEERVFFQCRQATWSEEVDSESSQSAWNLDMVESPLHLLWSLNPVRQFTSAVELYSARKLTFGKDKLIAFRGLEGPLGQQLKSRFLFGLPLTHFDWALLWDMTGSDSSSYERTSNPYLDGKDMFPSWSWCCRAGGVNWRLSLLSGTLHNLRSWLVEHTWIVWSWGDDDSDVKDALPPCPGRDQKPSDSEALETSGSRWSGYGERASQSRQLLEMVYQRHGLASAGEKPPISPSRPIPPKCLHFWSLSGFFQLSRKTMSTDTFKPELQEGLHRFGILDSSQNWCGTIVLEKSWFQHVGGICEFVAVSEARDFSMEELDTWNYYVPEEREASEWNLYYAFLIERDSDSGMHRRRGLAKLYQSAFDRGSFAPKTGWREFFLA